MKKDFLLAVVLVVSALFFTGCKKVNSGKQNDEFYGALVNLSLQVFKFDSSTKGPNNESFEEYVDSIYNYVQDQFSSIIPPSCNDGGDYYQAINKNDILNTGAFELIDLYGTEEFSDILYYSLYGGKSYSVDDIYNNGSLLPNEKVAAVLLLCFDTNEEIQTKGSNPCLDAYDTGMAKCRKLNYLRIAVSTAIGFLNPYVGAVAILATAIDNDTCTGNVSIKYRECVEE